MLGMMVAEKEKMKGHRRRNPTGLTYKQRRALAAELIAAAGGIVENLRRGMRQSPERLDPHEVAAQLTVWLQDLPGDYWDKRLGRRHPQRDELEKRIIAAVARDAENTAEARPGVKVPGFDL
jgi:hypothetical protein